LNDEQAGINGPDKPMRFDVLVLATKHFSSKHEARHCRHSTMDRTSKARCGVTRSKCLVAARILNSRGVPCVEAAAGADMALTTTAVGTL
jgi:hypothetical protein